MTAVSNLKEIKLYTSEGDCSTINTLIIEENIPAEEDDFVY